MGLIKKDVFDWGTSVYTHDSLGDIIIPASWVRVIEGKVIKKDQLMIKTGAGKKAVLDKFITARDITINANIGTKICCIREIKTIPNELRKEEFKDGYKKIKIPVKPKKRMKRDDFLSAIEEM